MVTSAQTHLLKIAKLEKLKIESSPAAPNLSKQGAWSARSHKIRPLEYHNSNTLNFSCILAPERTELIEEGQHYSAESYSILEQML